MCAPAPPALNTGSTSTAAPMPPSAISARAPRRRRSRSCPSVSSRLASRPTTRKKNVIRTLVDPGTRRSMAIAGAPSDSARCATRTSRSRATAGWPRRARRPRRPAARPLRRSRPTRKSRTGAATLRPGRPSRRRLGGRRGHAWPATAAGSSAAIESRTTSASARAPISRKSAWDAPMTRIPAAAAARRPLDESSTAAQRAARRPACWPLEVHVGRRLAACHLLGDRGGEAIGQPGLVQDEVDDLAVGRGRQPEGPGVGQPLHRLAGAVDQRQPLAVAALRARRPRRRGSPAGSSGRPGLADVPRPLDEVVVAHHGPRRLVAPRAAALRHERARQTSSQTASESTRTPSRSTPPRRTWP